MISTMLLLSALSAYARPEAAPNHLQFAYGIAKAGVLENGDCGHYLSVTITRQDFKIVDGLGTWSGDMADRGVSAKFSVAIDSQWASEYEQFHISTEIFRADGTRVVNDKQIFRPDRPYTHPQFEVRAALNEEMCADEAYFLAIPEDLPTNEVVRQLKAEFHSIDSAVLINTP